MDAGELMDALIHFPQNIICVCCANPYYFTADFSSLSIGGRPSDEYEVPFELDQEEISRLALMLEKIGVVTDALQAQKEIGRVPSQSSRDLCSLWYLVPETDRSFQNLYVMNIVV